MASFDDASLFSQFAKALGLHNNGLSPVSDVTAPLSSTPPCTEISFPNPLCPPTREEDDIFSISAILQDSLVCDDVIEPSQTIFQGLSVPKVRLFEYASRLVQFANCYFEHEDCVSQEQSFGMKTLIYAMVILRKANPVLNPRSVHRYLLVATLVAMKSMEDSTVSCTFWSAVGGVTKDTLLELELAFCLHLGNFDFHVSQEQFSEMKNEISRFQAVSAQKLSSFVTN